MNREFRGKQNIESLPVEQITGPVFQNLSGNSFSHFPSGSLQPLWLFIYYKSKTWQRQPSFNEINVDLDTDAIIIHSIAKYSTQSSLHKSANMLVQGHPHFDQNALGLVSTTCDNASFILGQALFSTEVWPQRQRNMNKCSHRA